MSELIIKILFVGCGGFVSIVGLAPFFFHLVAGILIGASSIIIGQTIVLFIIYKHNS